MSFVPIRAFKSALKQKQDTPGASLRKALVASTEPAGDRVVKFTISTDAVDRDNDTVAQDGWELAEFLANPVVLWSHDASSPPIGRCIDIGVEDGKLKASVEFVPADMPVAGPMAEMALRMCREGFISATSVGFLPTEYVVNGERTAEDSWFPAVDFTKQTLMEFSLCSIPANPEALIEPGQRAAPIEPSAQDDDKVARDVEAKQAAQTARINRLNRARRLEAAYAL